MALSLKSFTVLVTVLVFVINHGGDSVNFPLSSCFTDKLDFLFLLIDENKSNNRSFQHTLIEEFVQELTRINSSKEVPLVMFADVIDKFSALNPHVNVSSWSLHSSPRSDPYGLNEQQVRKQQYENVQKAIEMKVTFVERLFSEMGGVRENVTHIGVIFLDGSGLSYKEIRSVPHIIQHLVTHIKIFVVVVGGNYEKYSVYLSDTLLFPKLLYRYSTHVLLLAICSQCMEGWFLFEHTDSTSSMSCYTLMSSEDPINWVQSMGMCQMNHSYLSAIETENELMFLQKKLFSYIAKFGNHIVNTSQTSVDFYVQINIALQRDVSKPAKRFHWKTIYPVKFRPLLVHNWLPGKPSGGRSNGCGSWQFIQNGHCNATCRIENSEQFMNGWVDVDCETRTRSFTLCELELISRIEDTNLLKIKPAKNERFGEALIKGEFITFRDNIVSISANIATKGFIEFLRQSNIEFPVFDCGVNENNPRYISYVYVCDNIDHCSNKRDETLCYTFQYQKRVQFNEFLNRCNDVHCCDGSCLPLQFVNDGEIDCFVCGYDTGKTVTDESEHIINYYKRNETCAFFCSQNTCIKFSQLNDGRTDCFGDEGPIDERIGKLPIVDYCNNAVGQSLWAPRCVYVEDSLGAVLGCRDMSHLKNCTDFECPEGYFKCPKAYCIPQHYVLDEKFDCPAGEDEERFMISPCSGNFACWNSQICLHPDLVCDGHPDCPFADDEIDCDNSCPDGFRCLSGTVTISNYNKSISFKSESFNKISKYMDLSGLELSVSKIAHLCKLHDVMIFILSNCKIPDSIANYFSSMSSVRYLDLSYNIITSLDGNYVNYFPLENVRHLNLSYNMKLVVVKYLQMTFLETLDLSHTSLTNIDESFFDLSNLNHLNLSFTLVADVRKNGFHSNVILGTLDLRGLAMKNVFVDMFNGLTVQQHMYTDSFQLCCPQIRGYNIPSYACHAPDDAISSCFHLIGANVQRVLLWAFAVFAVLGNMAVIGYRVIWDKSILRTGYGLFVTNLAISDFIMGVNMFIIAGADYYYRDIYVLYDKIWRESLTCKFVGFLATLSSETSILFIFFITLDRFLMMRYPFGEMKFTNLSKIIVVFLSWFIGILLAISPILFNFEIYSSNAVCLGLPLTKRHIKGWEFSFIVFIVFNCSMCLTIAYGQSAIFRAMSENSFTSTTSNDSSRREKNITIARQLFLVALSSILSWFPIGFMALLLLGGHQINSDVYAWTAVIVLPITSAANPLLYTIPVIFVLLTQCSNLINDRSRFKK